jgi:3-dehydroquinate dehydratase-2
MTYLIINGPNLNTLGKRDRSIYGTLTLDELNTTVEEHAHQLHIEVSFFQSNSEGAIIDHLQSEGPLSQGIVINPGAFTHYGLSLRDALSDLDVPIVEVHLSNIYSREPFRHNSVIAGVVHGQISGLGWYGYVAALNYLVNRA